MIFSLTILPYLCVSVLVDGAVPFESHPLVLILQYSTKYLRFFIKKLTGLRERRNLLQGCMAVVWTRFPALVFVIPDPFQPAQLEEVA